MLGFYENFPSYVHRTERFLTSRISNRKLQQAIIQALHEINGETFTFEEVAKPTIPKCTIMFEFGIADGDGFNYLDSEETNRVLEFIRKRPLQLVDFLCIVKYYKDRGERKTPLKFDYYMIRIIFGEKLMETNVFHEKGLRHIFPEDIISLIVERVNKSFSRSVLKKA